MHKKQADIIHELMLRGMSYVAAKKKAAGMMESVDTSDLKSNESNRDGSSPSSYTKITCPKCGNIIEYDETKLEEPLVNCNKCNTVVSLVQI